MDSATVPLGFVMDGWRRGLDTAAIVKEWKWWEAQPIQPTLPDVFTWDSQVVQYPHRGDPGVSYFAGELSDGRVVDCLLHRDDKGILQGILNYYREGVDWGPDEKPGNVNLWVKPGRERRGIGTELVQDAVRRWGVSLEGQRYTVAGAHFALHLMWAGKA